MTRLNNIIITGASSGIGYELAKIYADSGVNLGLIGRDRERLNQCVAECKEHVATVQVLSCDVRDADILKDWLLQFDQMHPADLIIANAGIINTNSSRDNFEDINTIKNILDVNFYGALNTVMPILDMMLERRRGQVAIMCSLSAFYGLPVAPAYSMSKASLLVYFQCLREKLARKGVSLTIICPGYIDTPMACKLPINKPFMVSPAKAASIIKKGIVNKKRLLAFPLIIKLFINLIQILPPLVSDKILFYMCSPKR